MYKKNQVRVIKTEKSTAFKYLQGIWIIPHAADIRIVFKNDSTFEFHDYNSIKDSIEILKGIYVLNNDQLTLRYTDRPQQKFIYHFGRYEDERYIRKGKYYFVKQLLLSGKNRLKALYPFIHRCCSRFTYSWAWFSVLNYKHYKMCLF